MLQQGKTFTYVIITAVLLLILALFVGNFALNGDRSLLRNVAVQHEEITPNADGDLDITRISYELSRNATVSIYFENEVGEKFYFRRERPRGADEYSVLFSGVVEGYRLPDETVDGEIISRLLQNGRYTWHIEATDENGRVEAQNGTLIISDADIALPEIRNFTLDRDQFTPNRDGIDDRVQPQFGLAKDVAELRVYLLVNGLEQPISISGESEVEALEAGYHVYDYDAGVDDGATPPPDGTYPIIAEAQDAEGQRIRVQDELTIALGGVPRVRPFAPPSGDTLRFEATAVVLCDTLEFEITVVNYGETPVRTSGPPPGTIYDSNWNFNTLGWHTESGVFRVGIGFENQLSDYPYRWAVGSVEDLELINGRYYLMPGERAIVSGGIRVVDVFGDRNPQPMWAGIIHEDVEVSQFNARIDPKAVQVDIADPDNRQQCAERDIPLRNDD